MARPRNADGQRTRGAILDAALDLFADKGFFGTSLRDVARVVGVRESALYNYFPSKDALFEALIAQEHHDKAERLSAVMNAPVTDVRALLEQVALTALENYAAPRQEKMFRILLSDGIRLSRDGRINLYERLSDGRGRLHDLMRRLSAEGWLRAGDPRTLAIAFTSPLIVWRHLHAIKADLPMLRRPRVFARQHVEQFLSGAALPAPTSSPAPTRAPVRARSARRRPS
jgi:AcrR family transcriptional regulator